MKRSRFPLIRMVPMIFVMGTIFFLSHQPARELNLPEIEQLDKVVHFIIYAILAMTVLYVPDNRVKRTRPKTVAVSTIIFCFLYGISDELHQSFIPERVASGADLVADLCGILFISGIWIKMQYSRENN